MRTSPAIGWPAQQAQVEATAYMARHLPRLRSYLTSLTDCPLKADELANDTSEIIFKRWDRLRGEDPDDPGPPRAYLVKVATHLANRRYRRQDAKQPDLVPYDTDGVDGMLAALDLAEMLTDRQTTHAAVHRTLALLDVPLRQVLWLRHAEGFSTEEAATALSIPQGTVKSRLAKAVSRFTELVLAGGALNDTEWGPTR